MNQTVARRFQLQRGSSTLKGRKERPMLALSALLVGTALLGLPAAAQTTVAASLLAGIISVDELSTSEPRRPNTTIPEKIQPQENGTTGSGEPARA